MTLSTDHQTLVELIENWCRNNNDEKEFCVYADKHDSIGSKSPPKVKNYRPDLVWMRNDASYEYIGEAKTNNDVRNDHTRKQLKSFMVELEEQGSGMLVVAVPWGMEGAMNSMLTLLQKNIGSIDKRWLVISNAPKK